MDVLGQRTNKRISYSIFIEEVYEAVECIENNNDDLKEELGDVLLHIVFQSSIANEKVF